MAKLEPYVPGYYLWSYMPSIAAAAIFLVLFLGATGIHFFKLFRSRAWFNIPLAIGGICMCSLIRYIHPAKESLIN